MPGWGNPQPKKDDSSSDGGSIKDFKEPEEPPNVAPVFLGDIPKDELIDGEKPQVFTFKFQGIDEETGELVDGTTYMNRERLEKDF